MRRIAFYCILLLLMATPVFAADLTQDAACEAAWLFTEGSGTQVDDSSPNANVGTFKGTGEPAWSATVPSYSVSGTASGSATFDGTDDTIGIADVLNLNDFTIVFWVRPHSVDTGGVPRYIFDDAGGRLHTVQTNDGFLFQVYSDSGWRTASKSACFSANTWYLCICTKSSTAGIKVYVNDSIGGTTDANTADWGTSGRNDYVGGSGGNAFDGEFTGLMLFSKVLSAAEMTELYQYGPTGQPAVTALSQVIIIGEDYD